MRFSLEQCKAMLISRADQFAEVVERCVPSAKEMPAPRYVAHLSLSYNIGAGAYYKSSVARLQNAGHARAACDALEPRGRHRHARPDAPPAAGTGDGPGGAVMPLLALLRLVPIKAWPILAAIAALALWYWRATDAAYDRGKTDTVITIQKGQIDAQDRAEAERRKLDRGDDSSVRGFDRDYGRRLHAVRPDLWVQEGYGRHALAGRRAQCQRRRRLRLEREMSGGRTALERITALEERFDGLKESVDGLAEKIDLLINQGIERGQAIIEMRGELARVKTTVAGLKGDTVVIRRALFLARVGGWLGRFLLWAIPLGTGLFVWLGDRWELLVSFTRGSGR